MRFRATTASRAALTSARTLPMGFSRRRLCPLRRSLSGVVNASAREWKSSRHPNLSAPAVLGDALALWALCRSIFGWRRPPGRDCDSISTSAERPERSEEHTSELQSHHDLVCRLLLE